MSDTSLSPASAAAVAGLRGAGGGSGGPPVRGRYGSGWLRALLFLALIGLCVTGWFTSSTSNPQQEIRFGGSRETRATDHAATAGADDLFMHARALAAMGPRGTGQPGCETALNYVANYLKSNCALKEAAPGFAETGTHFAVRREDEAVLQVDHHEPRGLRSGLRIDGDGEYVLHALQANGVSAGTTTPEGLAGTLVWLGDGRREHWPRWDLTGCIAVLDFNSGDAWLDAAGAGAVGCVFLEPMPPPAVAAGGATRVGPATSYAQADAKYLATLPLHLPRLYATADCAAAIRQSAEHNRRATLHCGLRLETVLAPYVEVFIRGTGRAHHPATQADEPYNREILVVAHLDGRSVAPALAYAGNEVWAAAGWLAMVKYFAAQPSAFDLRFVLFTGHWQDFAVERAWAERHQAEFGSKIAAVVGMDFSPDSRDVNILSMRGFPNYAGNEVLGNLITRQAEADAPPPPPGEPAADTPAVESKAGFLQMLELLAARHTDRLRQPDGNRFRVTFGPPFWMHDRGEDPRYRRPDLTKTPRFYDASDPFRALGVATVSVGCAEPQRPLHNTPLDRLDPAAYEGAALEPATATPEVQNLRTQFFYAMGFVSLLASQPRDALPAWPTQIRTDYAGRVLLHLQIVEWDARRLWYLEQIPQGANLRTYVMVLPTHAYFSKNYPGPIFPRVTSPSRTLHAELQAFDYAFIAEVSQSGAIDIPGVYASAPDAQISVLAFTVDEWGRVTHASDLGRHGTQAFPILNVDVKRPELSLQIKLFPCGTLTLFDLAAPVRKQFTTFVERQHAMQWGGGDIDAGESALLPIAAVQIAGSHTEPDSYSWIQQRQTAMVFLPPDQPGEVIVGHRGIPMAIFNNASADQPEGPGYRLQAGSEKRLWHTLDQALYQSQILTLKRLERYRTLGVASPTADAASKQADLHRAELSAAAAANDAARRQAGLELAMLAQDGVYKESYRLLVDVVSTTIFYFLVLLPFSYLVERLLFPQVTLTRSAVAAGCVFVCFAALLYLFHPGFRLADNILVALISFLVVILTLPALFLTMGRGLNLIRDWGRRELKQHSAGADAGGVALAALSLAVSNMRRRKLRTGLTLTTITLLVLSLVVLTTTSAELTYRRTPSTLQPGSYRGVQVFNALDHLNGLHEEMVDLLRREFAAPDCLVAERRYLDPGYEVVTPVRSATRRGKLPAAMFVSATDAELFPALARPVADGGVLISGRWIDPGDTATVVVPAPLARDLDLLIGDRLQIYRLPLTVVGIVDPQRYEQQLDVNHKPLTTYSFHTEQTNHREPEYNACHDCVYVADGARAVYGLAVAPARGMIFRPAPPTAEQIAAAAAALRQAWPQEQSQPERKRFAGRMPAARERLEALRRHCAGEADAAPGALSPDADGRPAVADLAAVVAYDLEAGRLHALADRIAALNLGLDVYLTDPKPEWQLTAQEREWRAAGQATAGDTVLELAAAAEVTMKQSAMMIFPLLIAFFMILSIMIGSVYERKQEIYVFSAVGLAPRHVAIMFLAEAVVYAGIAAVLGYFLGIILLGSLRSAGMLPANFYPNYLGVFVVYSALLAFAATLLSALYPIWLAGRMVNPSLERTWSIDETPQGSDWSISLPFIAGDRREAQGILCFLRHFLEFHVGSRSGGFALPEEPGQPYMDGADALLPTVVWLAPFERNILQEARVVAQYDPARNLYLMRLRLQLISGQASLWQRSAHVFVDALRKQLLVWRGLPPQELQRLLMEGDMLFAAPSDPNPPVGSPAASDFGATPVDPGQP